MIAPVQSPGLAARIGFARADLAPAPDLPARNWGASSHDHATGFHRPLFADAVVFSSDSATPLVLLSLDLGWWRDRAEPEALLAHLRRELSLPPERLLVTLAHTHAGPVLHRAAPASAAFLDSLLPALAALVRAAFAAARPATLTWGRGRCDLATARDLFSPDHDRHLTGHDPSTPADDTVLIGRAVATDTGVTLGVLVNYACHPTTLGPDNSLLSPDYVGALRETVEQDLGGAPCVFLLGACGELAPAEQYLADPAVADRHGRRLGLAVRSTLAGLVPADAALAFAGLRDSGAPLALWQRVPATTSRVLAAACRTVGFPLKPDLPAPAEIERLLAAPGLDPAARERLLRLRGVRSMFGTETSSAETLTAWRLGDALLCAHPFEAYSALQLGLRAGFAPRPVLVLNIANGWRGYLPPADQYSRNQYSVSRTPFAPGGLELLLRESTALLSSLSV